MQEELLKRADSIFNAVGNTAAKAAELTEKGVTTAFDVAKEQLPDIAYQFIAYNRVYYTILVTSLLMLIAIQQFFAIKNIINKNKEIKQGKRKAWEGKHYLVYEVTSLVTGGLFRGPYTFYA